MVGSRADSAFELVLGIAVAVVVVVVVVAVVVVEGNDGVDGQVPRWDIAFRRRNAVRAREQESMRAWIGNESGNGVCAGLHPPCSCSRLSRSVVFSFA